MLKPRPALLALDVLQGRGALLAAVVALMTAGCGGADRPSGEVAAEDTVAADVAAVADTVDAAEVDAAEVDTAVAVAPPADLVWYSTGDAEDAPGPPTGPALILMGGGADVDEAFRWSRRFVAHGDLVVLRASGADGYNDYLMTEIGGVDSVETLILDTRAKADAPWVAERIRRAESIFIAGGDQWDYAREWVGSAVPGALAEAWGRGAVIGGTSAGLAVLGAHAFVAERGSVTSAEALGDPYDRAITLAPGLVSLPVLAHVITDSHFAQRDRLGRLVAWLARLVADGTDARPIGVGVDEATALVIDERGVGTVIGRGAVHVVTVGATEATCVAGEPLAWEGLRLTTYRATETVTFPGALGEAEVVELSVGSGVTEPPAPY